MTTVGNGTLEVLKKSLIANNLPVSGNKEQMLARLLSGQPDKRKRKRRVDDGDDAKKATSFKEFAEEERLEMAATGLTDENAITEEIARRWAVVQSSMKTAKKQKTTGVEAQDDDVPPQIHPAPQHGVAENVDTSDAMSNMVVLPSKKGKAKAMQLHKHDDDSSTSVAETKVTRTLEIKLSDADAAAAGLTYVNPVPDGHMYITADISKESPVKKQTVSAPPKNSIAGARALGRAQDVKLAAAEAKLSSADKPQTVSSTFPAGDGPVQHKHTEKNDKAKTIVVVDEKDEINLADAEAVAAMRLEGKVKKEKIISMLEDFGIYTKKGSKNELSKMLSEQILNETDDED